MRFYAYMCENSSAKETIFLKFLHVRIAHILRQREEKEKVEVEVEVDPKVLCNDKTSA